MLFTSVEMQLCAYLSCNKISKRYGFDSEQFKKASEVWKFWIKEMHK